VPATPSTPVSSEAGELIAQTDTGRKSQTSLTQLLSSAQPGHETGDDEKAEVRSDAQSKPAVATAASQSNTAAQSATGKNQRIPPNNKKKTK